MYNRSPARAKRLAGARSLAQPRLRLLCLALLCLPVAGVAAAQAPQPADGALYLGTSPAGRPLLVDLTLGGDGGAKLRVLEAPPRPGEAPAIETEVAAAAGEGRDSLTISGSGGLRLQAPLTAAGTLDPFGGASLEFDGQRVELSGVGTLLLGGLRFADGTFAVLRQSPFFYADPWAQVLPAAAPSDERVAEGLEQRRLLPDSVAGVFTESASTRVEALDADLLSVFTLVDTFTGGAHPNTYRIADTFLRRGDGWRAAASACEAAEFLGWGCDESAVRRKVIDALARRGAFWVLEGEVDEETPWLLDRFVLTPGGVSFHFDPYEAGPYVQGPFEVRLPYAELK